MRELTLLSIGETKDYVTVYSSGAFLVTIKD